MVEFPKASVCVCACLVTPKARASIGIERGGRIKTFELLPVSGDHSSLKALLLRKNSMNHCGITRLPESQ